MQWYFLDPLARERERGGAEEEEEEYVGIRVYWGRKRKKGFKSRGYRVGF